MEENRGEIRAKVIEPQLDMGTIFEKLKTYNRTTIKIWL